MSSVQVLTVSAGPGPLEGSVPVPSDEGVALARLAAAVLSRGESRVNVREPGAQIQTFLRLLEALGVEVRRAEDDVFVRGLGLTALPDYDEGLCLDLRGEVLVAGLALGLLAGRARSITILCDETIRATLGARLEQMGLGRLVTTAEGAGVQLAAIEGRPPGFDLQLTGLFPWEKQALLLLALRASSKSRIIEGVLSPDHLERVLFRARAPIQAESTWMEVHPPRDEDALAPSSYEFVGSMFVAGHLLLLPLLASAGGAVTVREVSTNRSASDLPTLLKVLGADIEVQARGDRQGEPLADITLRARGPLRGGFTLAGEQATRLLDLSLPLLAALARGARPTLVTDLVCGQRDGSQNVVQRAAAYLLSAGAPVQLTEQGILVGGAPSSAKPLRVTTGGDRRLALLGALLGSASPEPSAIDDVACLGEVFPRCAGTLRRLGALARVGPSEN